MTLLKRKNLPQSRQRAQPDSTLRPIGRSDAQIVSDGPLQAHVDFRSRLKIIEYAMNAQSRLNQGSTRCQSGVTGPEIQLALDSGGGLGLNQATGAHAQQADPVMECNAL